MEEDNLEEVGYLEVEFNKSELIPRQISFVDKAFDEIISSSSRLKLEKSQSTVKSIEHSENEPDVEIEKNIWQTIEEEFENDRKQIEEYKASKSNECDVPDIPIVEYMQENVLNLLTRVMEETFAKAVETESLKYQKSPFNGLDHMAQLLWNYNPLFPERLAENLFIHDMEWAKQYLAEHPRPYFPLSWIFTKDIAATKIQAYMRGYWVRRRDDVQEMRQFWKEIKKEPLIEELSSLNKPKFKKSHVNI